MVETNGEGKERINRVNYEIFVLQALRDKLRSKEIWVFGPKRYGNPESDLPQDFDQNREVYYQALKQPLDAEAFITFSPTFDPFSIDRTGESDSDDFLMPLFAF